MANKFIYFIVRNISLSAARWTRLVGTRPDENGYSDQGLFDQIPTSGIEPHNRTRKRFNLTGDAVLFRGNFDQDSIKLVNLRGFVRQAVNVVPNRLSASVPTKERLNLRDSIKVQISLDGTPVLELELFGVQVDDDVTTRTESHIEIREYMARHDAEWNPVV